MKCDVHPSVDFAGGRVCPLCEVSDPDARLDGMVEKAAVPSLATLFRKAKDQGAIKPATGYGAAN